MTQSSRRIWSCLRFLSSRTHISPASSVPISQSMRRGLRQAAVSVSVIGASALGLLSLTSLSTEAKAAVAHDPDARHQPLVKRPSVVFNFLADVVERTAPAVVKIEIPIHNRFFREAIGVSAGSGFLISEDGLILTNAHVVANSRTCKVILSDGREMEGTVEAIDEVADLATVKISGRKLPTIRLGSSSSCRAGEFVVALGSPMHLNNSISHGIISSTHRRLDDLTGGQVSNMPYLQTDAAINVGNSGGPLVNLEGEAIGVNAMKLAEGIAFAIPIDYVILFLDKVKLKKESVSRQVPQRPSSPAHPHAPEPRRGFIGVTMLQLSRRIADQIRSANPDFPNIESGILVMKVIEGSPAHQSGLQPNDVIVKVNGKNVANPNIILEAIQKGQELVLDIKRGSKDLKLTILPQEHNVFVLQSRQ